MAALHIGTQNWSYRAWLGPFYPPETPRADMLEWYARMFSTIEVDATFYAIPAEPVLQGWLEQVPAGFTFSLKAPQEVTHVRRLDNSNEILRKFVRRVSLLGDSLGAVLVQLPPDFIPTADARASVRGFVLGLPSDVRWAMEFRHPDWLDEETLTTLRERNVAVTLVDGRWVKRARMLKLARTPTADFAYVRWMGSRGDLTDYSRPQLDRDDDLAAWAEALGFLGDGVDVVFGYFNNQFQGHSPHSAREMQRHLGQDPVEPMALREQEELF